MDLPLPPGAISRESRSSKQITEIPLPVPVEEKSGELTVNESSQILNSILKTRNRNDPNVIRFIEEFVRCKSISEAAEKIGIHPSVAYNIRHREDVTRCIQKLIDKSLIKYGFDASELVERMKEIVDFDPIQLYNRDGTFKSNLYDIDPAARRNLKKLKVKNLYNQVEDINGVKSQIIIGEVIEYEFYDKLKATELVGREKEIFKNTTRVEHDITKNMESILLESAKRGEQRRLEGLKNPVIDIPVEIREEENDEED